MTLRVGRLRPGTTAGAAAEWGTADEVIADELPGAEWSIRYPPCRCPHPSCPEREGRDRQDGEA